MKSKDPSEMIKDSLYEKSLAELIEIKKRKVAINWEFKNNWIKVEFPKKIGFVNIIKNKSDKSSLGQDKCNTIE